MGETETALSRKAFHVSLNVRDLTRAVSFYETLFGVQPAKRRDDYAKFEIEDPALVLSLEPARKICDTSLNHLGLRMSGPEAIVDVQRRLEERGYSTRRENGVACCYAKQTKFWVRDPDNRRWEVYVLEEDLEHRGSALAGAIGTVAASGRSLGGRLASVWRRTRRALQPANGVARP